MLLGAWARSTRAGCDLVTREGMYDDGNQSIRGGSLHIPHSDSTPLSRHTRIMVLVPLLYVVY